MMTRKLNLLKQRFINQDDFPWKTKSYEEVGGLDISFCPEDPPVGCATLVVLDFRTLCVVLEESAVVCLDILGFMVFRKLPFVDGLTMSGAKQLLRSKENFSKDDINLIGSSGHTWGVARVHYEILNNHRCMTY